MIIAKFQNTKRLIYLISISIIISPVISAPSNVNGQTETSYYYYGLNYNNSSYYSKVLLLEICDNGVDDEGDGFIDNKDVIDCPPPSPPDERQSEIVEEICRDDVDNPGDGRIDEDPPTPLP